MSRPTLGLSTSARGSALTQDHDLVLSALIRRLFGSLKTDSMRPRLITGLGLRLCFVITAEYRGYNMLRRSSSWMQMTAK